jgi:hypothetical protein
MPALPKWPASAWPQPATRRASSTSRLSSRWPVQPHFEFDDDAYDDYLCDVQERGDTFERYASVWCHTHPGNSPQPSGNDEDTLARVFGRGKRPWAVMFILARGGDTYARLQFTTGPGGYLTIPVEVDWADWTGCPMDAAAWRAEYKAKVFEEQWASYSGGYQPVSPRPTADVAPRHDGYGNASEERWERWEHWERHDRDALEAYNSWPCARCGIEFAIEDIDNYGLCTDCAGYADMLEHSEDKADYKGILAELDDTDDRDDTDDLADTGW